MRRAKCDVCGWEGTEWRWDPVYYGYGDDIRLSHWRRICDICDRYENDVKGWFQASIEREEREVLAEIEREAACRCWA